MVKWTLTVVEGENYFNFQFLSDCNFYSCEQLQRLKKERGQATESNSRNGESVRLGGILRWSLSPLGSRNMDAKFGQSLVSFPSEHSGRWGLPACATDRNLVV